jgi:hypothetical protein
MWSRRDGRAWRPWRSGRTSPTIRAAVNTPKPGSSSRCGVFVRIRAPSWRLSSRVRFVRTLVATTSSRQIPILAAGSAPDGRPV